MNLTRVDYDPNSPIGSVQACLQKKQQVVRSRADGGVTGIGPKSCCSFVSYQKKDGTPGNVFGNSRIRIPYKVNGVDISTACVHGELTALWNVMTDENEIPPSSKSTLRCRLASCTSALTNILKPSQEVFYSFKHPGERQQWEFAAQHLCAG